MMRSGFLLVIWKEWISPPEKLKLALMQQSRGQRRLLAFGLPPKGGTETLIPGTQNEEMGDIGTGLYKLILYPPFGAEAGYEPEAGTVVGSIDNLKVWESAQTQLETLAQMGTAVDFAADQGSNADAQNITGDLNLSAGLTPGGLKTLSWESGNPAVISNEGKVTRPAEDTAVTLTPPPDAGGGRGRDQRGICRLQGRAHDRHGQGKNR